MPLLSMGPILRHARTARYGVAAFNMIDFNSVRAIIDGASDRNAPIIVQVSVKTIRHWGYRPIAQWTADLAADADVPVALHLDHCNDIDVIRRCIDAGWTSVMFDGSALPFQANLEATARAYDIAGAAGVGLEAELGAIGGTEDDKVVGEDETMLAKFDECLEFAKAFPNLAVFAPAIGTAHGFYKGTPKIAYALLDRITAAIEIPIALHGGTGLSPDQFRRCIASGCAKVNISTMHKHQFVEGFIALREREPRQSEPIPFIAAQYDTMKAGVVDMIDTFGSSGKASACLAA